MQPSGISPREIERLIEASQKLSRIEGAFIANDLKHVIEQGDNMPGDKLIRGYGMIAAGISRIVLATPNQDKALYQQALDGGHEVVEMLMGTSDLLELSLLTKAHLVEAHAVIGRREDPDKQLSQARETLPGISVVELRQALEHMVQVTEAQYLLRVSGREGQAVKLLAMSQQLNSLPFYGTYRQMVGIEVKQGVDFWSQVATPSIRGTYNLAFLSIFMPVSDLMIALSPISGDINR